AHSQRSILTGVTAVIQDIGSCLFLTVCEADHVRTNQLGVTAPATVLTPGRGQAPLPHGLQPGFPASAQGRIRNSGPGQAGAVVLRIGLAFVKGVVYQRPFSRPEFLSMSMDVFSQASIAVSNLSLHVHDRGARVSLPQSQSDLHSRVSDGLPGNRF